MLNICNFDARLSTSQSLEDPVRSIACCSDKRRGYMSKEDGRSTTTFFYYFVNHQSSLQRNTVSKLSHIFLIKMCRKLNLLIWGRWWFHRSKDFEAMKAGKSTILFWLSCQYSKNTLMDLPFSMAHSDTCTSTSSFIC